MDSEELDSVTFSIHASAKEATTPQAKHTPLWAFFNPLLREGGDEQWCPDISENPEFSIHASAKEATAWQRAKAIPGCFFNPRLREGGDGIRFFFGGSAEIFNPRLREGGDGSGIELPEMGFNFQSTPPRRRRLFARTHTNSYCSFQSTPPRRRRRNLVNQM